MFFRAKIKKSKKRILRFKRVKNIWGGRKIFEGGRKKQVFRSNFLFFRSKKSKN